MYRWMTGIAVMTLAMNLAGPVSAKHRTRTPKCTSCGMKMATRKSATMSKAVKIGKRTYWCCAGCTMKG